MSLTTTIRIHRNEEAHFARETAKSLLRGRTSDARYCAEWAAYHLHLAFEYEDTQTIALNAQLEYLEAPQ